MASAAQEGRRGGQVFRMTNPKFTKSQVDEGLRRARIKHEMYRPQIVEAFAPLGEIMADSIWDAFENEFRKTFEQLQ